MAIYKERGLRDLTSELGTEGVGIAGGFIVGGVVGRQVETMLMRDMVSEYSPITDKVLAWAANNGSKAILYYLAKRYDAQSLIAEEATEALAGSIVYDTILRLAGGGVNTADVNLAGYRILGQNKAANANVQKLVQENSILRTELNKALQKLASSHSISTNVNPGIPAPVSPALPPAQNTAIRDMPVRVPGYGTILDPIERQKAFGAMPGTMPRTVQGPIVPPISAQPPYPPQQQVPTHARPANMPPVPVSPVQSAVPVAGQLYPGMTPGLPPGRTPVPAPLGQYGPGQTTNIPGAVPGSPYAGKVPNPRKFGAMPFNPEDQRREQAYASMPFWTPNPKQKQYGFAAASGEGSPASAFGMQ